MHEAIDIIRGKADQDYLDAVTNMCHINDENQGDSAIVKQIIYLDRNNTPDIWGNIQATIQKAYAGSMEKQFKTVLVVPEQHADFNMSLYHQVNPICP